MEKQDALPAVVHGEATRAIYVGSIYPVTLQEPLVYHGYRLGDYIHAWTEPLSGSGFSESLLVSGRFPDLAWRGTMAETVERARSNTESSWRSALSQTLPTRSAPSDAADLANQLGFNVTRAVVAGIRRVAPDVADLFPFARAWHAEALSADGRLVLRIRDRPDLQFPQSDAFVGADRDIASELLVGARQIAETASDQWWSRSVFTFADRYSRFGLGNRGILAAADLWLIEVAMPAVEELNRQRVSRALLEAPLIEVAKLMAATVVISSDTAMTQGTAFRLQGVGWVTCAHGVEEDTVAFRSGEEKTRFPVAIKVIDRDVDLAILEIPGLDGAELVRGESASLTYPSPVTAVGFPNHNFGDSVMIRPGMVVSTRRRLGFGRFLTSVGIIAGMSGGPVIDNKGLVVGVAATGSKTEGTVEETEFHSFIPIEEIDRLLTIKGDPK